MPAGALVVAYALEVSPKQEAGFLGGLIESPGALQGALDFAFDKSGVDAAPAVTFLVDTTSSTRAHPIRDAALLLAFGPGSSQEATAQALARRLAAAMDNRSKPSLLVISVHEAARLDHRRVLLWTFPQQQVFNLRVRGGHTDLELLEAFNRESLLRKVALLEGPNTATGLLTARVLDFQSTEADRSVADLWIDKFLSARLQMSNAEGTRILAKALRSAHAKTRKDLDAQDAISSMIARLRSSTSRWSIDSVADDLHNVAAAEALRSGARSEERLALFRIDGPAFDGLVQYTRFTLANGVIVSAPFVEIGDEGGVQVIERQGSRLVKAEGVIIEEQVRSRA